MSFHVSASNIRVEDRSFLKATLRNGDGEEVEAEIDLNSCIGNNNGQFEWGGENFAYSANPDENIWVSIEGDESVPVLRASLADADGNYHWHDCNLAERIGNDNGAFVFA